MTEHENEKTQIIADLENVDKDEDQEKTQMIDPSVLEEELSSARAKSKDEQQTLPQPPESTEPEVEPELEPDTPVDNLADSIAELKPKFIDADLKKYSLAKLRRLLNDAEGRMTIHENKLVQLEEVQGEKLKKDLLGHSDLRLEIEEIQALRDEEREKVRAALVDMQLVSEAIAYVYDKRQAKVLNLSLQDYLEQKHTDSQRAIMPWEYPKADVRRIRLTIVVGVIIGAVIAVYIPTVDVPTKIMSKTDIPDRLASVVLERKKKPPPPPPPILKPRVEEVEVPVEEIVEPPEVEPRIKPPPKPIRSETAERLKAREKVKKTGVLAQSDVLARLAAKNTAALKQLGAVSGISVGGAEQTKRKRRIITATSGVGSGGIVIDTASRSTGGVGGAISKDASGVIDGIDVQTLEEVKARELGGAREASGRTSEEIQIVFDQNKSRLYRIYQRELRKNPALRGQIVFKLTISPAGKVTECAVVSSDIDSPNFERLLVARIKLLKFPDKPGSDPITIKYPIDFLPS